VVRDLRYGRDKPKKVIDILDPPGLSHKLEERKPSPFDKYLLPLIKEAGDQPVLKEYSPMREALATNEEKNEDILSGTYDIVKPPDMVGFKFSYFMPEEHAAVLEEYYDCPVPYFSEKYYSNVLKDLRLFYSMDYETEMLPILQKQLDSKRNLTEKYLFQCKIDEFNKLRNKRYLHYLFPPKQEILKKYNYSEFYDQSLPGVEQLNHIHPFGLIYFIQDSFLYYRAGMRRGYFREMPPIRVSDEPEAVEAYEKDLVVWKSSIKAQQQKQQQQQQQQFKKNSSFFSKFFSFLPFDQFSLFWKFLSSFSASTSSATFSSSSSPLTVVSSTEYFLVLAIAVFSVFRNFSQNTHRSILSSGMNLARWWGFIFTYFIYFRGRYSLANNPFRNGILSVNPSKYPSIKDVTSVRSIFSTYSPSASTLSIASFLMFLTIVPSFLFFFILIGTFNDRLPLISRVMGSLLLSKIPLMYMTTQMNVNPSPFEEDITTRRDSKGGGGRGWKEVWQSFLENDIEGKSYLSLKRSQVTTASSVATIEENIKNHPLLINAPWILPSSINLIDTKETYLERDNDEIRETDNPYYIIKRIASRDELDRSDEFAEDEEEEKEVETELEYEYGPPEKGEEGEEKESEINFREEINAEIKEIEEEKEESDERAEEIMNEFSQFNNLAYEEDYQEGDVITTEERIENAKEVRDRIFPEEDFETIRKRRYPEVYYRDKLLSVTKKLDGTYTPFPHSERRLTSRELKRLYPDGLIYPIHQEYEIKEKWEEKWNGLPFQTVDELENLLIDIGVVPRDEKTGKLSEKNHITDGSVPPTNPLYKDYMEAIKEIEKRKKEFQEEQAALYTQPNRFKRELYGEDDDDLDNEGMDEITDEMIGSEEGFVEQLLKRPLDLGNGMSFDLHQIRKRAKDLEKQRKRKQFQEFIDDDLMKLYDYDYRLTEAYAEKLAQKSLGKNIIIGTSFVRDDLVSRSRFFSKKLQSLQPKEKLAEMNLDDDDEEEARKSGYYRHTHHKRDPGVILDTLDEIPPDGSLWDYTNPVPDEDDEDYEDDDDATTTGGKPNNT
jgi:hypothetical protein